MTPSLDEYRMLRGDGYEVRLTQRQSQVMSLLLTNDLASYKDLTNILWPIGDVRDSRTRQAIRSHMTCLRGKLRRYQAPLSMRCIYGLGYILEVDMTDHTKTRPVVDQAIKSVRGAIKESTISDGMTHGAIDYSTETGVGESHHENDDVTIDVVITPKFGDET